MRSVRLKKAGFHQSAVEIRLFRFHAASLNFGDAMNALALTGQQATMSSREIAELTGKRHDNVKRLIDELINSNVILEIPQIEDIPTVTKPVRVYHMKKRETLIVVARLSPEFTAAVVDRWQELESKQSTPAELSRMEILKIAMAAEEGRLLAISERDEAVRTKAMIGSKREATAMATAAAKAKEVSRLKAELGRNHQNATVKAVEKKTRRSFGNQGWRALRDYCLKHGLEARNVTDEQYGTVKAWPAAAWFDVYWVDLNEIFQEVVL